MMHKRNAEPFNFDAGGLPHYLDKMIVNFFANTPTRQERLFWDALALVRRQEASAALIRKLSALDDRERARLWRAAQKCLNTIEFPVFQKHLNAVKESDTSSLIRKLPFGRVRAVQELARRQLRDILWHAEAPKHECCMHLDFPGTAGTYVA